jgi:hypothetical protein
MNFFFKFYNMLGNTKHQRFIRFIILIVIIGFISMLSINLGYDKTKGGWYWKPADISIKKD